jgi:methylmalonyl-CoA mutase cobalamin-binding subunit
MMRLAFPQYFEAQSRHLTYHVVKIALERAGHVVTPAIEADTDAVLFSICDVVEYPKLVKAKKAADAAHVPLIAGGAYAFNYWSAGL